MHAYLVLGECCDGRPWDGYQAAPHLLHEALATAYTDRFLQASGDRFTLDVWQGLASLLPREYQAHRELPTGGEALRAFVMEVRRGRPVSGLSEFTIQFLQGLVPNATALARMLGPEAYLDLWITLEHHQQEGTGTRWEHAGVRWVRLFRRLASRHRAAVAILSRTMGLQWPTRSELRRWQLAALFDGLPVGGGSLRLKVEWIDDTPGLSAVVGAGDLANEPALGLPSYDTLRAQGFEVLRPRTGGRNEPSPKSS
jgi:hypothetical protein